MLNNDFKVLVEKYTRYEKQKKKTRLLKILSLFVIMILAYIITTFDFTASPKETLSADKSIPKKEQNATLSTNQIIQTAPLVTHTVQTPKEEPLPTPIKQKKPKAQKTAQPKVNQLRLQVTSKKESLAQLTQNQQKLNNYSATIALANYHYSKKEYQDAIKWAIEASKKNKSKARPWIIYAKCKKELGNSDLAKKALILYLKRHQSQEAQELLNSL